MVLSPARQHEGRELSPARQQHEGMVLSPLQDSNTRVWSYPPYKTTTQGYGVIPPTRQQHEGMELYPARQQHEGMELFHTS